MKTVFLSLITAFCFTSCISLSVTDRATQTIGNPDIAFDSLKREDYSILEKVSGEGTVYYYTRTKEFSGDTLKYGYLDDLNSMEPRIENIVNASRRKLKKEVLYEIPMSRAVRNAAYSMIEKAKKLGADAIIFIQTFSEVRHNAADGVVTTHATVSGIAIKLKKDNELNTPQTSLPERGVFNPNRY